MRLNASMGIKQNKNGSEIISTISNNEIQVDEIVEAKPNINPRIINDKSILNESSNTYEPEDNNEELFHIYGLKPFIMKCIDEKPEHITDYTYDDLYCECDGNCRSCKMLKNIFRTIFKK